MKRLGDTRNQHYVFQGYLRGFAKFKPGKEKQAQVYVADLLKRTCYSTNVRNVAAVRDFNRLDTDDHDPNILENHLSVFESDAAAAIRRVASAKHFEGDDRVTILNLIALMTTHHPHWRRQFASSIEQIHRKSAQIMFATKERYDHITERIQEAYPDKDHPKVDYETMKDFIDRDAYDIVPSQNFLIDIEMKGVDHVLPHLGARSWSMWVAGDGAGDFVTTDHPANLVRSDNANLPAGHAQKNTIVMFPLTRKIMLTGEWDQPEKRFVATKEIVAGMNSMVIERAMNQVYAFDEGFFYSKRGVVRAGKHLHQDPATNLDNKHVKAHSPPRSVRRADQ